MLLSARPLSEADFADRMARLGPFESAPRLAVAVSGGADSMALCRLAEVWARRRGGSVLALTVDHGLRPEAAAEADEVGRWLAACGIAHAILRWSGPKPSAGLQAAAREARYRLLEARCRAEGILHLLLAHHRDDQAETVLLRVARGSGVDGLAGMAALRELGGVRLLRPLLDVPRARLAATCAALGQPWLEDPSNRMPRFARARLREAGAILAREGLTSERLADVARRAGRARAALETATADWLGRTVTLYPEGYAELDPALLAAPEEIALRALARCLLAVGGGRHPPRLERLERPFDALGAAEGDAARLPARTLAGCRLLPWRGRLLVCREAAAATERVALAPGDTVWWDRRFRLHRAAGGPAEGPVTVARLGTQGWAAAVAADPALRAAPLPAPVRPALPALWDARGLLAVPALSAAVAHLRPGAAAAGGRAGDWITATFAPPTPLAGPTFRVVSSPRNII